MADEGRSVPPPGSIVSVKFGGRVLTGPGALLFAATIVAVMVTAVYLSRPSWWMLTSAGIWIGFTVYWSAAARRAAPIARSETAASRRRHELLLNLSILLLFVPVPGLSAPIVPGGTGRSVIGLAIQVCGVALAWWARRHLGLNWSAVVATKVGHQLVDSGPYRWVRHPIYTAVLTMAVGTFVVSGSLHGAFGVLMMAVVYARKIPMEEAILREAFGETYDAYRRRSWAIVPGVL